MIDKSEKLVLINLLMVEIVCFDVLVESWWDLYGKYKMVLDFNWVRLEVIE